MDWMTVAGKGSHWPDGMDGFSDSRRQRIRQTNRGSRFALGSGELTKIDQNLVDHPDGGAFSDAYIKMQQDLITVYLYGVVVYDDVFTKDHPGAERITQFCFQLFVKDGEIGYRTYDRHLKIT